MSTDRFADKVIIVTGGGSGIGAATAHRFAGEGALVVVVGRTDEKLRRTVAAAPADAKVVARVADVSDEAAITAVIDEVAHEHGQLDVLVNGAGIGAIGTVADSDTTTWRQVMAVDVDGVFFASRAAIPHLRKVGGNIVNIGSVSGFGAEWGLAAYSTAKGAVVNLTNAMALDHAGEGLRVNAVHPSLTNTDMSAMNMRNEKVHAAFRLRIPMGRAAEPAEVADAIAFLASSDARFVNGAHLTVDGGLRASSGQPHMFL